MKTLKAIQGHIKWVHPKNESQHDEVSTQLQMLSKHPKIEHLPTDVKKELEHLRNADEYEKAIKAGVVKKVKPHKCDKIDNHTFDEGSFYKLSAEKQKHIEEAFKKGKVHMPIILRNKDTKHKWLLAGNTRLTYNSQVRKKKTPCLMVDY
jgi:hypothetical protein